MPSAASRGFSAARALSGAAARWISACAPRIPAPGTILLAAALALALIPARASLGAEFAGEYVAARHAAKAGNYRIAARLLSPATESEDPSEVHLENAIVWNILAGDMETAIRLAKKLDLLTVGMVRTGIVKLMTFLERAKAGDFENARGIWDTSEQLRDILPPEFTLGWLYVGQGQMSSAFKIFTDSPAGEGGLSYQQYYRALALAMAGDFEGASDIFEKSSNGASGLVGTRGAISHTEFLSQSDRPDQAVKMLDTLLRSDPNPVLEDLRAWLLVGQKLKYSYLTTPQEGLADLLLATSHSVNGDDKIIYLRGARYLDPDNPFIAIETGDALRSVGQNALALEVYGSIPVNHPLAVRVQMRQANTLFNKGDGAQAVSLLESLAAKRPKSVRIHTRLGQFHQHLENHAQAKASFDKAISLGGDGDEEADWDLYFGRAIALERMGRWEEAKSDFREASRISEGDPTVLNYLAYSMAEQRESLDEAERLILEAYSKSVLRARPRDPENSHFIENLAPFCAYGKVLEAADLPKAFEFLEKRVPTREARDIDLLKPICESPESLEGTIAIFDPSGAVCRLDGGAEPDEHGYITDPTGAKCLYTGLERMPELGYITDSLGWIYYRQGRFEESVPPLERAAVLEPLDPTVNDHLGDAYWMTGRFREAEFQWKMSLSYGPEPDLKDRIMRKLEVGLDAVIEEESS